MSMCSANNNPVSPLTSTIFWDNFYKTDQLSLSFSRDNQYSFASWFWSKSLIQVENHLCRFLRNSSTVAPLQDSVLAKCARSTVEFLHQETPDFMSPKLWPPNSPDLNPIDCPQDSIVFAFITE